MRRTLNLALFNWFNFLLLFFIRAICLHSTADNLVKPVLISLLTSFGVLSLITVLCYKHWTWWACQPFFLWNLPNCCLRWHHLNVCMMLPNLCLRFIFLHSFIHQQYQTEGLSSGPRASVDVAGPTGRFSGWSHKDQRACQLYFVLYGVERGCRKSDEATLMMPQQCHQCSSEFRQKVCVGRKM